jgi:hypothetical protein
MAEALQAQRGGRACGGGGGDGFALRDQPGGRGQQAGPLHLPGQLVQTQPEYIAKRGTSGIATSMAMLGRVQLPDWKVWVLGVVPVGRRRRRPPSARSRRPRHRSAPPHRRRR